MIITVHGNPAPQGSISGFAIRKGGVYTGRVGYKSDNPALGDWREAVRAEAQDAAAAELPGPLTGPVTVSILFRVARPQAHYGTGRNSGTVRASAPRFPMGGRRGDDLDKLARAVLDGLQAGGVIADDKQVVDLCAAKRYAGAAPAGAVITVVQTDELSWTWIQAKESEPGYA